MKEIERKESKFSQEHEGKALNNFSEQVGHGAVFFSGPERIIWNR